MDARASSDRLQFLFRELLHVEHNLYVLDSRAVVEGNELNVFVTSAGSNPTFHAYVCVEEFRIPDFRYFCSFHIKYIINGNLLLRQERSRRII